MKQSAITLPLLSLALACGVSTAHAQKDFPDKPLTLIVPFAAGGPTDVVARVVAQGMGASLGQSVVVDNRAGAGGTIGIMAVKRAKADGYTIGVAPASTHGVASNIYERINFDPVADFEPIGKMVAAPGVLIANRAAFKDCQWSSMLEAVRRQPGHYQYGSAGTGSLSHMTGEQFLSVTGLQMLHIPYKGLAPAITDLYSGQIHLVFDNVSSALPHIQSGRVCALAVQSAKRLPSLPDVPTYAELGVAELNQPTWFGLIAPKGTPAAVIQKINAAMQASLRSDSVKASLEKVSVTPEPSSPGDFARTIKSEIALWKGVVDKTGFTKLTP